MRFSIPAKTYLTGEYAVLKGAPALILTTTPTFEVVFDPNQPSTLHPQSPAGKWFTKTHAKGAFHITPPYTNALGGFGQSGAEFIAAWCATHGITELKSEHREPIWQAYRQLSCHTSGADILAQLSGGIALTQIDNPPICQPTPWPFPTLSLCLWHSQNKCQTHEHLATLHQIPKALIDAAHNSVIAWRAKEEAAWIECVRAYGHALENAGLVAPSTQRCLKTLRDHPSVLAAKGCGAMGQDVHLALCHKSDYNKLQDVGASLGLTPLNYAIATTGTSLTVL